MLFGNKVRETRVKKGLLLREVAAKLKIDTATISKIELGSRNASRDQVKSLSKILDIDYNELNNLWLGSKIYRLLEDEHGAIEALKVAEENIKYERNIIEK